ncbi:endolytic transglycosylase MltG [Anaeroselena agilis]|uniref:Endolytic murein transglycosylase n=1 Tax=Anaeroselena agilis TaxID=3063788 RepID=A0ABU3NTG5_9FIRM|nr:endolytic transglycosylase MltG [Selenomonadales bacterium 4137-cl]
MSIVPQKKALLQIAMLLLVLMAITGFEYWRDYRVPVSAGEGKTLTVTVKPEMTVKDIGDELFQNGIIHNATLFRIIAKVQGVEKSLQAGDYALSPNMSITGIIDKMVKGDIVYRLFTIPEGYNVEQIAKLLAEQGLGDGAKFKELARKYTPFPYMEQQPEIIYSSEGYIFPDTYRITGGMTEAALLEMMVANFDKKITPEMRERAKTLGLSLHQVMTLASLVEKEAKLAKERPVIAGVFFNRLKQGMPLQSCPTVQYILGYPKTELTIADTQIASPYNTYQNPGLPPGPIASPGMAALRAVLYPADTPYLYFVAAKDGSHRFSRTYEEHLAAVDEIAGQVNGKL